MDRRRGWPQPDRESRRLQLCLFYAIFLGTSAASQDRTHAHADGPVLGPYGGRGQRHLVDHLVYLVEEQGDASLARYDHFQSRRLRLPTATPLARWRADHTR